MPFVLKILSPGRWVALLELDLIAAMLQKPASQLIVKCKTGQTINKQRYSCMLTHEVALANQIKPRT